MGQIPRLKTLWCSQFSVKFPSYKIFFLCLVVRDLSNFPPGKSLMFTCLCCRYFDGSLVTAQLAPTGISKVNTAVQLGMVAITLAAPVVGLYPPDLPFFWCLWVGTAGTTVISGLSYLVQKDTYKLLQRESRARMERKVK